MKVYCYSLMLLLLSAQSPAQSTENMVQLLDSYAQHERLSGTVLVQQGDSLLFAQAYGQSDYETGRQNELSTVFNIGSISKQFTAAGILHLVADGKVDLQGPINDYLGPYASDRWEKVTVHHLLSHRSGIPSLMQFGQGLDHVFPEEREISLDELIGYFKDLKLQSKPGKRYQYNNSAYVLLAAIIETLSGQSFGEYMQTLFDRYGLTHTSHGIKDEAQLAYPYYHYTAPQRKRAPALHPSWSIGAGSIYSNAADLARWNRLIHSSSFLTAPLRQAFFDRHSDMGNGNYYAYGWQVEERDGQTCFHHDGTTLGYTSDLLYEASTQTLCVVLTNQTHASLNQIGASEDFIRGMNGQLLRMLDGDIIESLPIIQAPERPIRAGIYQFDDGYQLQIDQQDGKWTVAATDDSPLDYGYLKNLPLNTAVRQRAARAVDGIVQHKFGRFAKEADGQMKLLTRTGVVRLGMNSIMKGMGEWEKAILYAENGNAISFRLFCENGAVDFALYFDEEERIQGIFDTNHIRYDEFELPLHLPAASTASGLYLNGFHYGQEDVELHFNEKGQLIFQHLNRSFLADLVTERF